MSFGSKQLLLALLVQYAAYVKVRERSTCPQVQLQLSHGVWYIALVDPLLAVCKGFSQLACIQCMTQCSSC